jgi:hypothetical protein
MLLFRRLENRFKDPFNFKLLGSVTNMTILGAIEAGGTKFVCGIGTEEGEVLERVSFPTTTPEETISSNRFF